MIKEKHTSLFSFLLLLSGFAALSYEVLYARLLGNIIGNQWAVSSSILLTFILGIGFGSLYSHRMWRYLWVIEAAIGVYAAVFILCISYIEHFIYLMGSSAGSGLAGNVIQCVLLLSTPSFLIGCSLPLFAGYMGRIIPGLVFSRVYAVHSYGAALTVLLTEFWLLRNLGLKGAFLLIAFINGIISLVLLSGYGYLGKVLPEVKQYVHYKSKHISALALASVGSAVFQLWMVKAGEFLMGPFFETLAIVLGMVLLGLAIGSTLTRRFQLNMEQVLSANLVSLMWLVGGFQFTAELYAGVSPYLAGSYVNSIVLKIAAMSMLMLLPAISFGATIPALIRQEENVSRESGFLLFVSSLANAAGFLLMVFVLHRNLSYGAIIVVVACFSALALIVYSNRRLVSTVTVFLVISGIFWMHNVLWDEELLYVGHNSFNSEQLLAERRELLDLPETFRGRQDVFSLNWMTDGRPFFFINGYISINLNSPVEKIVGALASVFSPRTDNALVLGTGSGATASVVGRLFDRTDTVEINRVVIESLDRMSEYNFEISNMPQVNIIVDDAMHYVKASEESYSLIINTVTSPLYFSSSKLYTQEFLDSVKERLERDGVYVTWMDSRIGDRGVDIVLKTVSKSFSNCWMSYLQSTYFMLTCSDEDIAIRNPGIVSRDEVLKKYFYTEKGVVPEWIPYQVVSTDAFSLARETDVPINTLNYPALEFESARLRKEGFDEFLGRVVNSLDIEMMRNVIEPQLGWDPMVLGLHSGIVLKESEITKQWLRLLRDNYPDHKEQYNRTWSKYQNYDK